MGDRRNVELVYRKDLPSVFLYTHWFGSDLPTIVANALNSPQGRNRRNDFDYLARIIFEAMVKADKANEGETGFGIAPYQMDQNHPNIVVDLDNQTVDGMSYDEYIELNADKLSTV